MAALTDLWSWYRTKHFVIVCSLMIGLIIIDSVIQGDWAKYLLTMLLIVFIAAQISRIVFSKVKDERQRIVLTAILSTAVLALEFYLIFIAEGDKGVSRFFIILFAVGVASMVRSLFTSDRVDMNMVFAGILGYLLLGVLGAGIFMYVDHHIDMAFTILGQEGDLTTSAQSFYFSLVTMTTLGYGDIVPRTDQARVAASLLAVAGQLYVAIVISRLVALYMRENKEKQNLGLVRQAVEEALEARGVCRPEDLQLKDQDGIPD
jgi:voltage-gated potassium channel